MEMAVSYRVLSSSSLAAAGGNRLLRLQPGSVHAEGSCFRLLPHVCKAQS